MNIVGNMTVQHHLRHDVRLRAAVRNRYELAFLRPENPSFEVAERRCTSAYLEALYAERDAQLAGQEMLARAQQLVLV